MGLNPFVINCIRQPVTKESNRIQVVHLRKFGRPTLAVGVLEQSRYSTSIDRAVLLYIKKTCKYKKGWYNGGHDYFLLNYMLAAQSTA